MLYYFILSSFLNDFFFIMHGNRLPICVSCDQLRKSLYLIDLKTVGESKGIENYMHIDKYQ